MPLAGEPYLTRRPKLGALYKATPIALVLSVVLDGILRRIAGPKLSVPLFFVKDVLVGACFVLALRVSNAGSPRRKKALMAFAVAASAILILPFLKTTVNGGIILALFGYKEYALYPFLAYAIYTICVATGKKPMEHGVWIIAAIVVPTSLLACIQLRLPADNWLNMSVAGGTMEDFSAAGYLRVSSTFPFVAQYSMFLTFASAPVCWSAMSTSTKTGILRLVVRPWIVIPAYIVGIFITGSREAVWGCAAITCVASCVIVRRATLRNIVQLAALLMGSVLSLIVMKEINPDAFEAYSIRTAGTYNYSHEQEMTERIWHSLVGWASDIDFTILGNGLGVMSNGSQLLSKYAADARIDYWTETDLANTYYEGGAYLIFTWMALRALVVAWSVKQVWSIRNQSQFVTAAFLAGFITVQGLYGTLGIQPPLAIWFWGGVGLIAAMA